MKRRLLTFCLVSFSLICLVSSERAECDILNLYYSYTDPGSTRPVTPGNDPWVVNNPWVQAHEHESIGILPGMTIWWGAENWYVATNTTHWYLLFKGSAAQKLEPVPGCRAYKAGNPPTTQPPHASFSSYTNVAGGREFNYTIKPQPDWQVAVLKKFGKKEGDDADSLLVQGSYFCCSTSVSGSTVTIANSWFGLAGVDPLEVTEIIVFPDDVPIDTMGTHFLRGPGAWARGFVALDPYDQPRPLGGVKWTSEDGIGLEAGVVFSLGLQMTAAASSSYSLYAFDSKTGVYYHLIILAESGAIPTLSEWGAIIFGVLLLASVVFYIWRRRRVAMA